MNYESYFNNAKHNKVDFAVAYEMLSALLNITADDEHFMLLDQITQYKY